MRLLVVNNIPTPYNLSFFTALGSRPGVVARTVFLAPNDSNRSWRVDPKEFMFDYRVLPGLHGFVQRVDFPLYLHWGLWSEMRKFQPDAIAICGYHYFASLEVLAFARVHRRRTVLWSGSHLHSGFIKRAWVDVYKRWVITRFDAYLTYGSAAREQLAHYGAPPDRIVVGCNTVDVHWFKSRAEALRRNGMREKPLRVLFVGRLVPFKNVDSLIAAVGLLQARGLEVTLTIVGDGGLRQSLHEQVERDSVRSVTFAGHQAGDHLVQAYVDADVLVLPSLNEPWGLVVNEAAACAIPSIVSTRAGAARDLIREGETGLTFDPMVPGDLERALERLVRDRELCKRMGMGAQRLILTRDPAYYAKRLVEAAELALATHRSRR